MSKVTWVRIAIWIVSALAWPGAAVIPHPLPRSEFKPPSMMTSALDGPAPKKAPESARPTSRAIWVAT